MNNIEKIKVKNIYLKYTWKWKIEEEICLICQQEFSTCCSKCKHQILCVPCKGACNHFFHLHCINEWLVDTQRCPTCRSKWELAKVFSK